MVITIDTLNKQNLPEVDGLLTANDLVDEAIQLLIQSGAKITQENGKATFQAQAPKNTPWRYIKHDTRMHCSLWKLIISRLISQRLPVNQRFIPLGCHDCYKVVVRVQTYKGLLGLEKVQLDLNYPSKCGVETRQEVRGLYGGYFYCRGLQEGLKRYSNVIDALGKKWEFYGTTIILKRGCTEFEREFGPSDKWQITPGQVEIEQIVDEKIHMKRFEDDHPLQTEKEIEAVHELWQKFAYKFDYTYDGEALYPPMVTYHDKT